MLANAPREKYDVPLSLVVSSFQISGNFTRLIADRGGYLHGAQTSLQILANSKSGFSLLVADSDILAFFKVITSAI